MSSMARPRFHTHPELPGAQRRRRGIRQPGASAEQREARYVVHGATAVSHTLSCQALSAEGAE